MNTGTVHLFPRELDRSLHPWNISQGSSFAGFRSPTWYYSFSFSRINSFLNPPGGRIIGVGLQHHMKQTLYWPGRCVHCWTGILRSALGALDSSSTASTGQRKALLQSEEVLHLTHWLGIAVELPPGLDLWRSPRRAVGRTGTRATAVAECFLLNYWV